ncbi:hypothetical protein Taro_053400 [Colocasia esculenta]|uniref:Cathepsin propeptide inhibitor domain-containing protein n=1 Tax=Colocasia esculenta TaxID=4460 RepID=A0A843XMH6_COLES|nr:hypothetical protein [Colocasia esculenta]
MSSTPGDAPPAHPGELQPPPADADPAAAAAHRELTDEEVAEKHRAWMAEHGRVYADEAERERRLRIFHDNLRYIDAHNRGGHSYTLGLNQFADLGNEEFKATYCGGLAGPVDYGQAPPPGDDLDDAEGEGDECGRKAEPITGSAAAAPPPPPPEARTD